jgi:hypothetical protein
VAVILIDNLPFKFLLIFRDLVDSKVSENASENILDVIFCADETAGRACHKILFGAYEKLGELDALYGCGKSTLLEQSYRIKHFTQQGKYSKAMELLNAGMGEEPDSGKARN